MVSSCRGAEFCPPLLTESSSSDCSSDESESDDNTAAEAFADAADRWKVQGMKSFYLDSASRQLYCWDQPTGILFLYAGDACRPIWKASHPEDNATIWQTLPLPPTDAASLNANPQGAREVSLHVLRAQGAAKGAPICVREQLSAKAAIWGLHPSAVTRLQELPVPGLEYLLATFIPNRNTMNVSKALMRYIDECIEARPWLFGVSDGLLKMKGGCILGSVVPELQFWGLPLQACRLDVDSDGVYATDLQAGVICMVDGRQADRAPLRHKSILDLGGLVKIRVSVTSARSNKHANGWRERRKKTVTVIDNPAVEGLYRTFARRKRALEEDEAEKERVEECEKSGIFAGAPSGSAHAGIGYTAPTNYREKVLRSAMKRYKHEK